MQNFLPLTLAVVLCLQPHSVENCFQRSNRNPNPDARDPDFERHVTLDLPLYYEDDIDKFLQLCATIPPLTKEELKKYKDEMELKSKRDEDSACEHPNDPNSSSSTSTKYKNIELYFLKMAQERLKMQREQTQDVGRATVSIILFLIPLTMTIYLVVVGHFRLGDLPLIAHYYPTDGGDKTEGVGFSLYNSMEYHLVPGVKPTLSMPKEEVSQGQVVSSVE